MKKRLNNAESFYVVGLFLDQNKRTVWLTIVIGLLLSLLFCSNVFAQTKTAAVLTDWTLTAQNAVGESSELDVSGMFSLKLHIQHALTTHGTENADGVFLVQFASETGTSNEDWQTSFIINMVTGTPDTATLGTEAAGQTVLEVASTTGRYTDDDVQFMFIKDNTLASSEMVIVVSALSNTSVTILDGTTNAHTNADFLFDIADSRSYYVDVYQEDRLRVIIDNTRDAGGTTVTWRISYTAVTAN